MTSYQRRHAATAVRWFRDGDHPQVVVRTPQVVFSRDRTRYFISHADGRLALASGWLALDAADPLHPRWMPFALWHIQSGTTEHAHAHPALLARYQTQMAWAHAPAAVGFIPGAPAVSVTPGDWVVEEDGEVRVLSPEAFARTYTQALDVEEPVHAVRAAREGWRAVDEQALTATAASQMRRRGAALAQAVDWLLSRIADAGAPDA